MALVLRLVAPLVLVVAACGGGSSSSPPKTAASGEGASSEAADPGAAAAPKPITSLRRAEVRETVAQGLGRFLQNGTVDDWPVMRDGKFHGFKIKTINADWGVDLRPGDVITRVNGIVPEHPEDADAALRSLEKAPSLKVEYEREGKPRTLELPIVD